MISPTLTPSGRTVDPTSSSLEFRVRHFGVATVRGRFDVFSGRLEVSGGRLLVSAAVDVASVDSGNEIRDARLRTEFFQVDRHPEATLTGELVDGRLRGSLTIAGQTRPVDLLATVDGSRVRLDGRIRRSDFGLEWTALRDAGRLLVADEVRLVADVALSA